MPDEMILMLSLSKHAPDRSAAITANFSVDLA